MTHKITPSQEKPKQETLEEVKPHSFCETPYEKCTMNYCDENGCQNRKKELVEPKEEPKQETLEETGKRVSELVDAMDSNMEMFSITNQIDELGYAVSNMRDIIHEIVKILDVK
jgi:hypothetical protein